MAHASWYTQQNCWHVSAVIFVVYFRWIQEGFKGFSAEAPKPDSGAFSGRFGSDFGGLPGCNSDFCPVTPTFGL